MRKHCYIVFAMALCLLSCRPDINTEVRKSTADSFSPGIAKTGDTITIIGSELSGARVLIDDRDAPIIVSNQGFLKFIVTDDLTNGKSIFSLKVCFKDGTATTFSQSIVLNHIVKVEDLTWLGSFTGDKTIDDTLGTGPSQLLLTDFDGHGIRLANATDRFDRTQWTALVKTGGHQLITDNFLGVSNSPSKNNFLVTQLNPEFVEHKTSGFVGEFVTTTDVLNNRIDQWTINFSGILGGPINVPKTNNDLSDIYLNFFLFKNNKEKGWVRPYIYNDVLEDSLAFAYNLPVTQGNGEWALVSIPFKSLKTEYGNNFSMKARDYLSLNKLKFVFTHSDKEKERKNTPVSQLKTAVGDVQFYIDHIIITQGGAYVNPPKF